MIPIDSGATDLHEELGRLEPAGGVDCVVEAVGLPATFLQALQSAARFGQVVFMGNIKAPSRCPRRTFPSSCARSCASWAPGTRR